MNKLIVPISAGVSAILCAGVVTAFARGQDDTAPGQVLQPITVGQLAGETSTTIPGGASLAPENATTGNSAPATGQSLTYSAGEAGTATFWVEGRSISLEDVTTNGGWTYRIDDEERDEVELDFISGTTRLRMNAEIEDGQLRVRLTDRTNTSGDDDDDDDEWDDDDDSDSDHDDDHGGDDDDWEDDDDDRDDDD